MKKIYIFLGFLVLISGIYLFTQSKEQGQAVYTYKYFYAKDNSTDSQLIALKTENAYLKDEVERMQMLGVSRYNFNYTTGVLLDGFAVGRTYYSIWSNGYTFNQQLKTMIHEYYHTQGYKHGAELDKIVNSKYNNISVCLK